MPPPAKKKKLVQGLLSFAKQPENKRQKVDDNSKSNAEIVEKGEEREREESGREESGREESGRVEKEREEKEREEIEREERGEKLRKRRKGRR